VNVIAYEKFGGTSNVEYIHSKLVLQVGKKGNHQGSIHNFKFLYEMWVIAYCLIKEALPVKILIIANFMLSPWHVYMSVRTVSASISTAWASLQIY